MRLATAPGTRPISRFLLTIASGSEASASLKQPKRYTVISLGRPTFAGFADLCTLAADGHGALDQGLQLRVMMMPYAMPAERARLHVGLARAGTSARYSYLRLPTPRNACFFCDCPNVGEERATRRSRRILNPRAGCCCCPCASSARRSPRPSATAVLSSILSGCGRRPRSRRVVIATRTEAQPTVSRAQLFRHRTRPRGR